VECLICGKSVLSDDTLKHIANIKEKKPNIEKEIERVSESDPQLALKLKNKLKRYDEEIIQLENFSFAANQQLCDNCEEKVGLLKKVNNELEYLRFIEILEDFKDYNLKAKKAMQKLLDIVRWNLQDEDYYGFNDTLEGIQLNIYNQVNCEYFETRLLFISGYHNGALLLRLQKLLNELEKTDHTDYYEGLYKGGAITKEQYEFLLTRKEWPKNIKESIKKIKDKLGQY
jgi:hypothetical protein